MLEWGETLAILEAKYTWTSLGHSQIELLYRPVVEMALGRRVIGVVVCKVLVPGLVQAGVAVCSDLPSALAAASQGIRTVLHWIGVGALVPRRTVPLSAHYDPAGLSRTQSRMVERGTFGVGRGR